MSSGKHYSEEERRAFIDKFAKRTGSIAQFEKEHGINNTSIYSWAKKLGIALPTKAVPHKTNGQSKGPANGKHYNFKNSQDLIIIRDCVAEYRSGTRAEEVAKKYGITKFMIYDWTAKLEGRRGKLGAAVKIEQQPKPRLNLTRQREYESTRDQADLIGATRELLLFNMKWKDGFFKGIRSGSITDLDESHAMGILAYREAKRILGK